MAGHFQLKSNFAQTILQLKQLRVALPKTTTIAMRAVGVQVASWAIQDFRTKANGGTDPGGVSWRPITRGAIRTRLAKRAPYQTAAAQLKSLTAADRPLLERLRRRMRAGAKFAANRRAIARAFEKDNPDLASHRRRRQQIKRKRKQDIDREFGNHDIGIDTARLVNSLVFGEPALASIRVPTVKGAPPPKALFMVTPNSVSLGTNMSYAAAFDRLRPILSDSMITPDRKQKLEALVVGVIDAEYKRALK
jgi:hypothetical protein